MNLIARRRKYAIRKLANAKREMQTAANLLHNKHAADRVLGHLEVARASLMFARKIVSEIDEQEQGE